MPELPSPVSTVFLAGSAFFSPTAHGPETSSLMPSLTKTFPMKPLSILTPSLSHSMWWTQLLRSSSPSLSRLHGLNQTQVLAHLIISLYQTLSVPRFFIFCLSFRLHSTCSWKGHSPTTCQSAPSPVCPNCCTDRFLYLHMYLMYLVCYGQQDTMWRPKCMWQSWQQFSIDSSVVLGSLS